MKRRNKTTKHPQSDKIEVNRHKIYRITDPIQLSYILYPQKTANLKRAAFLAIFFELKNASKQRLESTDCIAGKYSLTQSCITKVRAKMVRIGLVRKQDYYWIFSSVFRNTLEKLLDVIEHYKAPIGSTSQEDMEMMYVEMAKGENKKDKESEEQFTY
jgi:hypothetical protein